MVAPTRAAEGVHALPAAPRPPSSLCHPPLRAYRHVHDLRQFVLVGWLMEDGCLSVRSVVKALAEREAAGELPDDCGASNPCVANLPDRLSRLFDDAFGRPVELYRRGYGQYDGLTEDGRAALRLAEAYLRLFGALAGL